MSAPALRPLRVGEILDAGIKLYLRNARVLIGLTAIVVVPLQALSAVFELSTISNGDEVPGTFPRFQSTSPPGQTPHLHAVGIGSSAVIGILSALASLLTTAACMRAISDAYLDHPSDIRSSLRFALRRLGSLLWLEILAAVLLALAFVALFVPGIWLYGAWSVAVPVLLIENRRGGNALRRSFKLVRGRWWPASAVLVVSKLITGVIGAAFVGVLIALAAGSGARPLVLTVIVTSLAGTVSAILTRPFDAAVVTILYYDLRVRHDGYDVELLAEQLGLDPAQLPASTVAGFGPQSVGMPGGPPFWPPPPGWKPAPLDGQQH
jgi:hypothetical protein